MKAITNSWALREVYFDENGEPGMHREPEQAQPVAWVVYDTDNNDIAWSDAGKRLRAETPLYTAPPQRKPLTNEEIGKIAGNTLDPWSCARAIEAAHGIRE